MFPYFQVSGGEVVHHPVSVFNPFNDVMQITQVNNVRMCIFCRSDSTDSTPIHHRVLKGTRDSCAQVSTNDTFIQLLAPGEFRQAWDAWVWSVGMAGMAACFKLCLAQAGQKRTPAGSSWILPERAGAVPWAKSCCAAVILCDKNVPGLICTC